MENTPRWVPSLRHLITDVLMTLNLRDPQSHDRRQKKVQLQDRESLFYDMQKPRVRSLEDSSRDRDLLILKLMAKW